MKQKPYSQARVKALLLAQSEARIYTDLVELFEEAVTLETGHRETAIDFLDAAGRPAGGRHPDARAKELTFADEARCIKNGGFGDAIQTIETAIHPSGIPTRACDNPQLFSMNPAPKSDPEVRAGYLF